MAIPDYPQILLAHNKDQWKIIADELKIPVPRTYELDNLVNCPDIIPKLPFPLLIKPKQGGGGWGIRQIDTLAEFEEFWASGRHEGLPWGRFLVQEKIEGETHCVAMVFCKGVLKGKVAYKQIREYPAFGGQATCRVSLESELAEGYFQKLMEHLKWHGVCQADFVVDKETQTPYLIDINPRFWGSLAQGLASGVDFPKLIYQIAMNGDVQPAESFRKGVVTRWLGGELRGFPVYFKQAEKKIPFLIDFLSLHNKTALWDDFCLRDPLPFLAWGADSLYRLIKYKNFKPHESLSGVWE